jgi:hypothetical protein
MFPKLPAKDKNIKHFTLIFVIQTVRQNIKQDVILRYENDIQITLNRLFTSSASSADVSIRWS